MVCTVFAVPLPSTCHSATTTQAFEWIAENAIAPAVVSMSVAGNISPSVNEAARRLVEVSMGWFRTLSCSTSCG